MVGCGYVQHLLWQLLFKSPWKYFVMDLIYITMKNWLVSENSWNNYLLIATIILLQLTSKLWKIYIPLLDEVGDLETVSIHRVTRFSCSSSCSTQDRTIYDLNLNSYSLPASTSAESTIGSWHTSEKEVAKEGGIYNSNVGGYCNISFPNVMRCINITLWFCNGCNHFNQKVY